MISALRLSVHRLSSLRLSPLRFIGLGLLFATLAAPVQALEGTGMLDGKEKLKVKSCGKEVVETVLVFDLSSNGAWTAVDDDSNAYSGTWTFCCVKRSSEKGFIQLNLSAESLIALRATLGERATALCGRPVELTRAVKKKFTGRVKNGKAKIKAKYDLSDSAEEDPVKSRWKLKAEGSFTEITP